MSIDALIVIVPVVTSLLAAIWYGVQIYDRFKKPKM